MKIKQFIEKSIEGGWRDADASTVMMDITHSENYSLFLDPLAWQAVGKVEGWDKDYCDGDCPNVCKVHQGKYEYCTNGGCRCHTAKNTHWKSCMHRMIDSLAEGKTIEEFIATL